MLAVTSMRQWSKCRFLLLLLFVGVAGNILAQTAANGPEDTKAWQQGSVLPPPQYETHRLIELTMPSYSSVKVGIDPKTLRIDAKNGVVSYVVVAQGPSAMNASYEGIHCATGEYRVYARQTQHGPWVENTGSTWKSMRGQGGILVTYPYQLARNGLCLGPTVRSSVQDMIRELESGNSSLYR